MGLLMREKTGDSWILSCEFGIRIIGTHQKEGGFFSEYRYHCQTRCELGLYLLDSRVLVGRCMLAMQVGWGVTVLR